MLTKSFRSPTLKRVRLGLVADPVTQAIGGSEFEDGLMPGSPGDVLYD